MHSNGIFTTTPLAVTAVVQQVDRLLTSPIDNEMVMMDLLAEKYYGLGPLATRIWQALAQPCQLDTLCQQLQTEYAVDRQTCQQDVLAFVQQLFDAQLVCRLESA